MQIAGGRASAGASDITWGQWRRIGREVAALGLNFNEISAANSGRKEKEGCDEREDEENVVGGGGVGAASGEAGTQSMAAGPGVHRGSEPYCTGGPEPDSERNMETNTDKIANTITNTEHGSQSTVASR